MAHKHEDRFDLICNLENANLNSNETIEIHQMGKGF